MNRHLDEKRIRDQFERYSNQEAIDGSLEEDDDELRVILMEEMQANDMPVDQWNEYLDKELSVFKNGERYDYVKDLQEAFQDGLSTPLAKKILKTVPAHVFWDIKRPIDAEEDHLMNEYNPARQVHGANFFDLRSYDEWRHEKEACTNMKPSVSEQVYY